MSPQCSDVVDIWGRNDGAVVIVWQPLQLSILQNMKHLRNQEHLIGKRKSYGKEPLYYNLYFGQTKTQVINFVNIIKYLLYYLGA